MSLGSAELLAAASYMTDLGPDAKLCHLWRVGLVARRIAASLAPDIQRDVFYAGLLQDIGATGSFRHITSCLSQEDQLRDNTIRNHAQRGAALLEWLPGMGNVAAMVKTHHEWFNGCGYPEGRRGNEIPLGGQILNMADNAEMSGCFVSAPELRKKLPSLQSLTDAAWSKDVWQAFIRSTEDAAFYKALMDPESLPGLVTEHLQEYSVPEQLNGDEGVERVLHLIAALLDIKDPISSGHSRRTANYAKTLTDFMGLSQEEVRKAYRAGLIHDCGRMAIPSYILNKPGRLSDKELAAVRTHARFTIQILGCLPQYKDMTELGWIAGHDHERFDGCGYPDKLAGKDIPLLSRVLCVVDAFDAMVTATNYRLLSSKCALQRLQKDAGKQFDPSVVEAMTSAVSADVLVEAAHGKSAA